MKVVELGPGCAGYRYLDGRLSCWPSVCVALGKGVPGIEAPGPRLVGVGACVVIGKIVQVGAAAEVHIAGYALEPPRTREEIDGVLDAMGPGETYAWSAR